MVLNRQVEKWFFRPAEGIKLNYQAIAKALQTQLKEKLDLQAAALADRPETLSGAPGFLERFCQEQNLAAVEIASVPSGAIIDRCGDPAALHSPRKDVMVTQHRMREGAPDAALLSLAAKIPLDIAAANRQIETYLERIYELDQQKNSVRSFYIMMEALIALFTLFVSTWIARLLAKQISGPIAALLRAADEVGEGNFNYRVQVGALDELAGLVRGFNEMTQPAPGQQRRTGSPPPLHRSHPRKHPQRRHLGLGRWLYPEGQSRAEDHLPGGGRGARQAARGFVSARKTRPRCDT